MTEEEFLYKMERIENVKKVKERNKALDQIAKERALTYKVVFRGHGRARRPKAFRKEG